MDKHDREPGIETVTLQIEGMECGCEATSSRRKMNALAGVRSHEINPITHQVRVSYDPGSATIQEIIRSVSETGMKASLEKGQGRRSTWWREKQQLALYGCGLIALIAFISGNLGAPPLVANGLLRALCPHRRLLSGAEGADRPCQPDADHPPPHADRFRRRHGARPVG